MSRRHIIALCLLIVAAAATAGAHAATKVSDNDRKKAEFLVNQSLKQASKENTHMAQYLLRQASMLDPDNDYISYLMGRNSDTATYAEEMMRRYALSHARDMYITVPYIGALYESDKPGEAYRLLSGLIETFPENIRLRNIEYDLVRDSTDRALQVLRELEKLGDEPVGLMARYTAVYSGCEPIDTAAILHMADSFAERHPDNTDVFTLMAHLYYICDKDSIAITRLKDKIASTTDNFQLRQMLADIYYDQGKTELSRLMLLDAMESPDTDPSYIAKSICSVDNDTIVSLLDTLQTRFPTDTTLTHTLFACAMKNDDAAKAEKYGDIIVTPESEAVTYYLMLCKLQLDKTDEALELYRRSKAAGANTAQADLLLPRIYAQKKDLRSFISCRDSLLTTMLPGIDNFDSLPAIEYDEVYSGLSTPIDLYLNEAELRRNLGDADGMMLASRNALTLAPVRVRSYALNNYAYFIADAGDTTAAYLDDALDMSVEAVKLDPSFTNFDTLAWVLFRLGRYDEAQAIMKAVIKSLENGMSGQDGFGDYYNHMADIYAMQGDTDKAVALWIKALGLSPDNKNIKEKIARRTYIPAPFPPEK